MSLIPYFGTTFGPDSLDVYDPYAGAVWPSGQNRQLSLQRPLREARETTRTFAPILGADIIEGENDFHVYVDLPGVDPADLDVNIANGFLHIKGERRQVHEEDTAWTHRVERSFGKVQRSVPIPVRANADSGEAKFENGVLTVKFSKHAGSLGGGRKLSIL